MSELPIQFKEVVQLAALGINPAAIGFATLTMESEKYVCVRDATSAEKTLTVVDLQNPSNILKRPTAADSALMHPTQNILALKDAQQLQIYDLTNRKKLNECNTAEPIEFWKWITDSKLALVSATSVYHWSMNDDAKPVKIFARHQNLAASQIISYRVDHTEQWCCLIGIAKQEERIVGFMQLYSIERKISQPIEGHAAAFSNFLVEGATKPSTLFCFASRNQQQAKLYILELGTNPAESKFTKKQTDIYFPAEAAQDFPVAMQVSDRYGVVYMITKFGYIHIFDVGTGKLIYMNRISADTIFVTAPQPSTGGIIGVNRKGQVLSVTVDENNVIPYICNKLNDFDLAIKLAARSNIPAQDLFAGQFNQLFVTGRFKEAAQVAASSPQGVLRTTQTIQKFQQLPAVPGQPSPLLQYFSVLLEKGKLNKIESLELSRLVLHQGRKELLQNWLKEDKLDCSEELGDLVRQYDINLALSVYYVANSKDKVIQCLAESGQYDRILLYAQKVRPEGYVPDWMYILGGLMQTNPAGASSFAAKLLASEVASSIDINQVVDLFMHRNMVQETTSLLLDVLKNNKQEEGNLQTRLLEINLIQAPQVADAILRNEMFSHFNKPHIANLCERAGLYQRALDLYTEAADIKRVILNARGMPPELLVGYFAKVSVDDTIAILRDLLRQDLRTNLQTVVQVATKYSDILEAGKLIELFETFNCNEGLFYYLGSIINFSQDPDVHFKYIEAAAKVGQLKDVERICRESNHFNPEKVKNFLKEARLPDQLPLIIVCDRFDFVEDLTQYLYKNNMLQFVEAYVQKINPINTPAVVGALLDVDCNEEYVKNLVMAVRNLCPVEELVAQVEKRNRLRLLLPWLEARVAEGNQEPATHNALMKIYIDSNNNAEKYLTTNQYYDSRVVGKYCENRDPHLAFVTYKRGLCDDELIRVTNKNALFKLQARYLVERQSPELWEKVLNDENEYRKAVIDQVIQTALPESKTPEEVSSTVKALMAADLPHELIDLLEKIVLETHSDFSSNKNLQNLLILTAIKASKDKVMNFINRLDNYDAPDIANIAIGAELYEEAFTIFKKFKHNGNAIKVLIDHIRDLDRAVEYAEANNEAEVWSLLAKAQLESGSVKQAIESYIKANDPANYIDVIVSAESDGLWEHLVKFLHMCRTRVKEPQIESELIYALAKVNKLAELEEFITGPNCAQIQVIGDRCFDEGLYEAAKLLFNNISNFARLATTLVKLEQYSSAVEAARKANSIKTWKEVNLHLVDSREFRLAQICALHIIIHGDELDELIRQYEQRGHFDELISVLESGLGLDRAHTGMFTELAVLYSNYKPEKLEEHLKLFHTRINVPKVERVCEKNQQWKELAYLYKSDNEMGSAATVMIEHPVEAWEHNQFRDVITKVQNTDILYKAVRFYLRDHPLMVNDLLKAIVTKVDHSKVVTIVRKEDLLPLVKTYLLSVQSENIPAINEALNELFIEEDDFEALRSSVDTYDKFDQTALAKSLEKHDLVEFRRIAAHLYKRNGQWAQSVELSKKDKLYSDAMKSAAESNDPDVVEKLLRFFVDNQNKECFAACLYTCYDYVRPDVVMELAWKHGYTDFAMPYFIQVIKEYTSKVDQLAKEHAEKVEKEEATPPSSQYPTTVVVADPGVYGYGGPVGLPPGSGVVGLPPVGLPPVGMPPMSIGGMGIPMGGIPMGVSLGAPGSGSIPTSAMGYPPAPQSGGGSGFGFM